MARSVQFVLYDPKTGAPARDNVPVKVYEVATTGRPNALPTTTVLTNALGVVVIGGLDDAKVYDFVLQTNPRVHQNEFNNQSIKISTLSLVSLTLTSLTVTGLSTLATAAITQLGVSGNLGVTGTLTVTGAASLKNNLDVTGAFAVTGAATLRGGLNVTGAVTGSGTITGTAFFGTVESHLSVGVWTDGLAGQGAALKLANDGNYALICDGSIYSDASLVNGKLLISDNSIYEYATNGVAELAINYYGYNGNTQFRNTQIYNGKYASIALFQGSNKGTYLYGPLSMSSTITMGANMLVLTDTNHGMLYNGTIDGPEFRGYSGFTWKTGSAGATERMRLTTAGLYSYVAAYLPYLSLESNARVGATDAYSSFDWFGGHATTQIKMHACVNGSTQDAWLYLWASEGGVTYDGCGIGNNYRYAGSWGREYTSRGGSYIRLLNNQMNFYTITDAGAINNPVWFTTDRINTNAGSGLWHYIGNAAIGSPTSGAAGYAYWGARTAIDAGATDHYALAQGNSDGQHTYLNSRPSADVKFCNHGAVLGGVDTNGIYVDDGKRLGLEGSGGDTYFKRNGATIEAYIDGTRRAYLDSTGWHW